MFSGSTALLAVIKYLWHAPFNGHEKQSTSQYFYKDNTSIHGTSFFGFRSTDVEQYTNTCVRDNGEGDKTGILT